jgi:hypothetical protein
MLQTREREGEKQQKELKKLIDFSFQLHLYYFLYIVISCYYYLYILQNK